MKSRNVISTVLLLAAIICSVSCGEDSAQTDAAKTETGAAGTTAEAVTEEVLYKADYLPEADYNGYVFRTVTVPEYPVAMAKEDGDVINDSIYKRDRIISERYNMNFEDISVPTYMDMTNTFKTSALAASNDFDLGRLIMRDAFSLAQEGFILPVSELPYVDITQDWYIHYVNDELTINDRLIFAYSDECINAFTGTIGVVFNKKIAGNLDLESPYELVDSGKWTYDKFFTMAAEAISDVNNDGKYSADTDVWGIFSVHDELLPSLWVSSGIKVVEKQDGIPVFVGEGNERLIGLLDEIYSYWTEDGICYDAFLDKGFDETYRAESRELYTEGHALFMVMAFGGLDALRDMEDDFGFVPTPKYDEEQSEYYARLIDGWACVPLYCCEDPERTSVIMESLAVESRNYVIPAVYDNAIKNKYLRDDESVRMLEMMQKNRVIDLGDTVWMSDIRNVFMDVFTKKSGNFSSAIAKNIKKIDRVITKAVEQLTNAGMT